MKKKLLLLLPMLSTTQVFALDVNCGALSEITRPAAHIILIMAPILLLVFSALDILKAVTSGDDKSMAKALSNIPKRFIICVVILLLPLIVNAIIGWTTFNDLTSCL